MVVQKSSTWSYADNLLSSS